MIRVFLFCSLLFLMACQNKSSNTLADKIEISVNADSSALVLKNIDEYIIKDLTSDTLADSVWAKTIVVYPKAQDEDLQDLQKPLLGKYTIVDENIVFTPDLLFKKGKSYLVELYLQRPSGEITDNLRSNSSLFNRDAIQKTIQF